jgi:hypothetical protein
MKKFKVTERSFEHVEGTQEFIRTVEVIAEDQAAAIDLARENDLFDDQVRNGEVKEGEFHDTDEHSNDQEYRFDYSAEEVGKATAK